MRKKKVLFILNSGYGIGGAERVSVTISKYLDRTLFDIVYCTVIKGKDKTRTIESELPQGSHIERIKANSVTILILKILLLLIRESADVVFCSTFMINTKMLALSWFFPKTKFIVRNNNNLYSLSSLQRKIISLTYRNADVVIAQTEEMRNELLSQMSYLNGKVVMLHNPIDTDRIEKLSMAASPYPCNNGKIIVASGRFSPAKGFDVLLKAFSIVQQSIPDAKLYILGRNDEDNPVYQSLINMTKALNIEKKVFFEGFKENPYCYIKNADCFVLSSRNEGLPNVLIEALYIGTPVAATVCIPIIRRIVKEGVNGYFADVENVESLAKAIISAVNMGRIHSDYTPATKEQFVELFRI